MRLLKSTFINLLILSTIFLSSISFSAHKDSWSLHRKAWNDLLNDTNKTTKHGFYANRLISVKHPEIYLQADLKILDSIEKQKPKLLKKLKENLSKVEIVKEISIYPNNAPFYPFIDRRILPPTATLVRLEGNKIVEQNKITSLEKAVLAYFFIKEKTFEKNPAILYCSDSSAYLVSETTAISMNDMQKIGLDKISCLPILLFDEEDSWFPILKNIPHTSKLTNIIKHFSQNTKLDKILTPEEIQLSNKLSSKTEINSDRERAIVLLVAQKLGPIIASESGLTTDTSLLDQWNDVFNFNKRQEINIGRIHTGISHLLMQWINVIGNRLSPMASYIADNSDCSDEIYSCIVSKYQNFYKWDLVWDWGFTSFSIDEALASGGGGVCAEQSSYMGSVLDLLGVDYYILHFTGYNNASEKKDHRILYVPSWDVTFSNNKAYKGFIEPNGYKGLVYIYNEENWLFFADDVVVGNNLPKDANRLMNQFLSMIDEKKLSNQIACKPFTNRANPDTCMNISSKIMGQNYNHISEF